jgi:hypothetical protein
VSAVKASKITRATSFVHSTQGHEAKHSRQPRDCAGRGNKFQSRPEPRCATALSPGRSRRWTSPGTRRTPVSRMQPRSGSMSPSRMQPRSGNMPGRFCRQALLKSSSCHLAVDRMLLPCDEQDKPGCYTLHADSNRASSYEQGCAGAAAGEVMQEKLQADHQKGCGEHAPWLAHPGYPARPFVSSNVQLEPPEYIAQQAATRLI